MSSLFTYLLSFLLHQLALALEEAHISFEDKQAVAFLPRDFLEDTEFDEGLLLYWFGCPRCGWRSSPPWGDMRSNEEIHIRYELGKGVQLT